MVFVCRDYCFASEDLTGMLSSDDQNYVGEPSIMVMKTHRRLLFSVWQLSSVETSKGCLELGTLRLSETNLQHYVA